MKSEEKRKGLKVSFKPSRLSPTADPDDMTEEDKGGYIKVQLKLVSSQVPDYIELKKEIDSYIIELPTQPDIKDLSKINKLYAIAQSFLSRVATIEGLAIGNLSQWERLVNFVEGYVEDKYYRLISSDNFSDMTNMKAEAAVKTKLAKEYRVARNLKNKMAEAKSFNIIVANKKKDLASVISTLGKQVRALELEKNNS
jgi:hypothetical protein